MKKIFAAALLLFALFLVNSCCKKPGYDGKATLIVRIKHHGETIKNDSAYPLVLYIKSGSEESPGTSASDYDKVITGEGTEDHVHIENLKCGTYFIYGMGNDTNYPPGYNVKGGQAIKIKHKDRKKEVVVDIAVTE